MDLILNLITDVVKMCTPFFKLSLSVFALSQDGAGKLPTGYAVIEGHPDLK